MRIKKMGFAAIASVAVENESNVVRHWVSADLPIEVALVNAVDQRKQYAKVVPGKPLPD
jgi:hypothetical protein